MPDRTQTFAFRLALLFSLLFGVGLAAASATTITLSAAQIPNVQSGAGTYELRIWLDRTMVDSTGVTYPGGAVDSSTNFKRVPCALASTTVTCDTFTLASTVDAQEGAQAKYTAKLYRNNAPLLLYNKPFALPASLGASVTWEQVWRYNNTVPNRVPDTEVYTKNQVNALYAGSIFANPATTTSRGVGKSSMNVADPTLTAARAPLDGSVTDAKVSASADIAPSKIAGTAVVTGDARLPVTSPVLYLDRQTGADFCAKLNAALAAAQVGQTIDGRMYYVDQTCASSVTLNKNYVQVLLPPVVITMGSNQWIVPVGTRGVKVVGSMPWGGQPTSGATLTGSVITCSGNNACVMVGDDTAFTDYFSLEDVAIVTTNSGASVVGLHLRSTRRTEIARPRVMNNVPCASGNNGSGIVVTGGADDSDYAAFNVTRSPFVSNYKRGIANNSLFPTFNSNSNSYLDVDIEGCGATYANYGLDISDGESNFATGRISEINKPVSVGGFNNRGIVFVENVGDLGTTPAGANMEYTATSAGNFFEVRTTTPGGAALADAGTNNSVVYSGLTNEPRYGFGTGTPESLAHFFKTAGYAVTVGGLNTGTNLRLSGNAVQTFDNNVASPLRLSPDGGGAVVGSTSAALTTTAADGYLWLPHVSGTPTGSPTAYAHHSPMVVDPSGSKLWIHVNGVWHAITIP